MIDLGEREKASHGGGDAPAFGDIVGQDDLKQALLAVAADDDLDGLLVRGEKGTAKSTAVRALSALLPSQTAVADCPYGCPPDDPASQCADCRDRTDPPTEERPVPLVTLPLGATRDRVVGTLSVADALGGDHEFDPGLLARANRGVLYVDEVNLLDDHLVDVLLDAAASGVSRVERDGVSVAHPAEFTLVGTLNPEEGDLRPQLRDRFALSVEVTACDDVDRRVEIIDRALSADGDGSDTGVGGVEGDPETPDYAARLRRARRRIDAVDLPREFAAEIAELCRDAGVDGHRGDIAAARAARALATLDGRGRVIEPDVRRAAELALPHRLRSRPFEDAPDPDELLDDHFDGAEDGNGPDDDGRDRDGRDGEAAGDDTGEGDGSGDDRGGDESPSGGDESNRGDERGDGPDGPDAPAGGDADGGGEGDDGDESDGAGDDGRGPAPRAAGTSGDGTSGSERAGGDDAGGDGDESATPLVPGQSRAGVGAARAPDLSGLETDATDAGARAGDGSRTRTRPDADGEGARVRTRRAEAGESVDAAASVRATAARGGESVETRDLRRSVRAGESSALVVFAVDASASMRPAMRTAKGTVLELLKDAYRKRDEVAFVSFAGDGADVLLPPTDSVTHAARHLKELPTGDRTPLPAGLRTAGEVIARADPAASVVVLVTDGRANVAAESPVRETRAAARRVAELGARVVVVDAGDGGEAGLAGTVAAETDGERVPLSALSAERVDAAVGDARQS